MLEMANYNTEYQVPKAASIEMLAGKLLISYLEYTFLKFGAKHIYQNNFFKGNF